MMRLFLGNYSNLSLTFGLASKISPFPAPFLGSPSRYWTTRRCWQCPWLILAGWLALLHLITAIMLAITIVGIPFAWAHVKLVRLALWPAGKMIVPA